MKQRCKVVALPTKEKTLMAYDDDTKEYFIPVCNFKLADSCSYIYLYIASYDEIKEGDYIITGNRLGIYMFDPVNNTHDIECKDGCVFPFKTKEYFKKVIATTDPSLNLPLIPEQFVKDYCDANGVEKVMCEVNDNIVSISPIKESWIREEVEALCRKAYKEGWIESFDDKNKEYSNYEEEFITNNL